MQPHRSTVAWANCPYCGVQVAHMAADQIATHIIACALDQQQQLHPEVDGREDVEQENLIFPIDEEC